MDRESSRLKMGSEDKEDRISGLCDSILCHILSFLPTKVLVLSHSVNINKFSLRCFKLRYPAFLNSWLSTAIMRSVREIELNLYYEARLELPECFYTCKTLEVLELLLDFVTKIPSSGMCFPNVNILFIEILYPENSLTERLFSSCPVLEELKIIAHFNDDDPLIKFVIFSSTLKRLGIRVIVEGLFDTQHNVMIRAPNLECLDIQHDTLLSYTVDELHSSCEVTIDIFCNGWEMSLASDIHTTVPEWCR
ncbi:F-box protein [Melia azedarach]|uniref:F-box protein n=1 Tax=Melia azedarach TaxID=155640 RepID=A0ACC1WV74_MELAZ|nr:F-box protein [Melia azedarach]